MGSRAQLDEQTPRRKETKANYVSRSPFGLVGMWLVCTAIESLHACYSRKQNIAEDALKRGRVLITYQSVSADKSRIQNFKLNY